MNEKPIRSDVRRFGWRHIAPVVITVATTLGLLLPMGLVFRGRASLSRSVDELQLDWLRLAVRIEDASASAMQEFYARLEQQRLRELSRFSVPLRGALRELPSAVDAVWAAAATADPVPADLVMSVDLLLSIIRAEAAQLDAQRDAAYRGLTTFVTIAAVGFALLWAYQSARVSRLTAEVKERRRISTLERRVRDQERSKLARELHDGAAQELAVAGMAADFIAKDHSFEQLPALKSAIDSAREEVRRVYRTMDPRFSRPSELPGMLRELAAAIQARSGQAFEVVIDTAIPATWGAETLLHVYRIIQECMHNVVRHARATYAAVTLRAAGSGEHGMIIVRIEDNGVGVGDSEEGYGRRGIRERVELLCGSVVWSERDSGGTVVEVVLPGS
ncbi:MAG: sensor histidine kinase [Spirochaetota bacterium]